MNLSGLGTALGPPLIYLALGRKSRGFVGQPSLVTAREPSRFVMRVAHVGGVEAVRRGVWVDFGFIVALTTPSGWVLAKSKRPELAALAASAALLDIAEDTLLLGVLRRPTQAGLRLLANAALAKYAAYGGLALAVVWVSRPR